MARKIAHRLLLSLLALIGGMVVGFLALGFAPVFAGLCPSCFGFHEVEENIWVETQAPELVDPFLARLDVAEERVERVFGAAPRARTLICFTPTCHKLMGNMGPRGMAYGGILLYLGPHGLETEIIAHEIGHIAIHRRVGIFNLLHFPSWVDEGLAVWLSGDPRYDLNPDTCDVGEAPLPVSYRAWNRAITPDDYSVYGRAGCAVSKWLKAHPVSGVDGLLRTHLGTR